MEAEMKEIIKEKEYVHDEDEDKDYASKGVGNAGLTLGIIGTALGAYALWGGKRNGLGGGSMPENVNINNLSGGANGVSAPTAFQAWEKECDDALALTNTIWSLQLRGERARFADRQVINQEMFGIYKSQIDADFGLYKNQRDQFDVLKAEIDGLRGDVRVMAAVRPYQDKLIQCEIDKAFTAGINYTDRKTCRMITGELVLPNTPTVTGYPSYSPCQCPAAAAPAA